LSSSSTVSSSAPLSDFHADSNAAEVARAAVPLMKMFNRAAALLSQFPDNEFLLQVCKVAGTIVQFHVTEPLGKLLVSCELLLRKAQEWEAYAAQHVSLRSEIGEIATLIGRWRQVELQSWNMLLRGKEASHARRGLSHWFSLMKIFSSAPEGLQYDSPLSAGPPPTMSGVENAAKFSWPYLKEASPSWLHVGPVNQSSFLGTSASPNNSADNTKPTDNTDELKEVARQEVLTESVYLNKIFGILDAFLRTCNVSEFPIRLHMVRLFALQRLQQEESMMTFENTAQRNASVRSRAIALVADSKINSKHARAAAIQAEIQLASQKQHLSRKVANMCYGVWRYYAQFLPSVRSFMDTLKGPIQQRLHDEIKLSKWDQLGTYAVIEHSEKIHRKLHRLMRQYEEEVLQHPMAALLQRWVLVANGGVCFV
jgi:midasin (ATPase involved in ribosome maturation)